ncbi:hypothetical protein [Bradyrhizobium sp. DOA9]|uniref:hypothetical protein n=1 Tax=Bradyrhizobium sp. DOA9 TaxID=1126627 RepID=UPI000469E2FD|nr:hypothetical protein [Bradyrhizobium sp. DOA9]GAJ35241.1 hypothetical protein BDOA9_0144420 [Bradyrhizobium sp. DOA9]
MTWMMSPPPEEIALEEAAHAVAMILCGLGSTIEFVTTKAHEGSWGMVKYRDPILRDGDLDSYHDPAARQRIDAFILAHLAGQYGRKLLSPQTWRGEDRSTSDYEQVKLVLRHLFPQLQIDDPIVVKFLTEMEARCEHMIGDYLKQVEALSIALLERETLNDDELMAVFKEDGALD